MDPFSVSGLADASRSIASLSVTELSILLSNEGLPASVADTFEGALTEVCMDRA